MSFYLVSAIPKRGVGFDEIEESLDAAAAWFRFARGQWLIYDEESDAEDWFDLLQEHVGPKGQLFITKVDVEDSAGWMTQEFWKWVDQTRA